jgi:hypothetical protein
MMPAEHGEYAEGEGRVYANCANWREKDGVLANFLTQRRENTEFEQEQTEETETRISRIITKETDFEQPSHKGAKLFRQRRAN